MGRHPSWSTLCLGQMRRWQRIDVAERAAWVSQFREATETIGQVGQGGMDRRGAHWEAPPSHAMPESQVQPVTGQIHNAFACIIVMAKGRALHISRQGNIVHIWLNDRA